MDSRATPKRQSSVDENMLQSQLLGLSLTEEELNALVRLQDKIQELFLLEHPQLHMASYSISMSYISWTK